MADAEWGDKALLSALNNNRHKSCAEIGEVVQQGISSHTGDAPQSDDITVLVIEYLNKMEA